MMNAPEKPEPPVTPELLLGLARYARLPLDAERAAHLAPMLAGSLAALRALQPDGYDDAQPAAVYQVPPAAGASS